MSEIKDTDREKLAELLAKVMAAKEPSRELDVAIECATGPWRAWSLSGGLVVPEGEPDYWVFTEEQANAIIAAYPNRVERRQHFAEFGTRFYTDLADPTALYHQGFASIHKNDKRREVKRYTGSIDAAKALVDTLYPTACLLVGDYKGLANWEVWNGVYQPAKGYASLSLDDDACSSFREHAETPPLAILAALLTALTAESP